MNNDVSVYLFEQRKKDFKKTRINLKCVAKVAKLINEIKFLLPISLDLFSFNITGTYVY